MNITKLTEQYISNHPSIKDGMKKGIINYSKLSRQIAEDSDIDLKKNFDAILIACRRYSDKLKSYETKESKVLKILKQSKVEIKNKIIVVVIEKSIYFDNLLTLEKEIKKKAEIFNLIEGTNAITLITTEEFLDKIRTLFKSKIIKENKDLVEITLRSPKEIETTPGVINYLYSLFWDNDINIVETMSCWTDTLFVIKEEDIGRIMPLLKF
ncbi:MAG: hypothetical protein QF824_05495 [Candidatus Woesearchaeota archaeon]|jgi:hypothetical protein|nr:hypothetical protein [Candidatus Woesearchaeota archaeon]